MGRNGRSGRLSTAKQLMQWSLLYFVVLAVSNVSGEYAGVRNNSATNDTTCVALIGIADHANGISATYDPGCPALPGCIASSGSAFCRYCRSSYNSIGPQEWPQCSSYIQAPATVLPTSASTSSSNLTNNGRSKFDTTTSQPATVTPTTSSENNKNRTSDSGGSGSEGSSAPSKPSPDLLRVDTPHVTRTMTTLFIVVGSCVGLALIAAGIVWAKGTHRATPRQVLDVPKLPPVTAYVRRSAKDSFAASVNSSRLGELNDIDVIERGFSEEDAGDYQDYHRASEIHHR